MIKLFNDDTLKVMDKLIIDGVMVDAIICDIPYGTTACKWDSVIDFEEMWLRLNKLIKPNGAIVLFGSEPFSSALRMSNIKNYKYDWVYQKTTPTGHLNAKKQPLRVVENMMVFYKKQCVYNPQKTNGHIRKVASGLTKDSINKRRVGKDKVYGEEKNNKDYDSTERYPLNIKTAEYEDEYFGLMEYLRVNHTDVFEELCNPDVVLFSTDKQKSKLHPTQKPVALMEYLIKTYTNENELVLDFTMGSGTTGVACTNLNRRFIGIELDENYFQIAEDRIYDF